MELADEGRLILFGCVIGIVCGLVAGTVIAFSIMQDEIHSKERSRNGLWYEAVARGYAEQLETEDGKPAYRWKEK